MRIDRNKLIAYLDAHTEELLDVKPLLKECSSLKRRQRYNDFKAQLGGLSIGEQTTFPLIRYESVRSSVCRYSKAWDNKFSTTTTENEIVVTRTA